MFLSLKVYLSEKDCPTVSVLLNSLFAVAEFAVLSHARIKNELPPVSILPNPIVLELAKEYNPLLRVVKA